MKFIFSTLILVLISNDLFGQILKGKITSNKKVVPFANIVFKEIDLGISADEKGAFYVSNLSKGTYNIVVSALGMETKQILVDINEKVNIIDIQLTSLVYNLDQVVITGTKTSKRKTKSAVIVNVIDSQELKNLQACNLAEGLNFKSAIRLETDCQTCNYTQLRMNGLSGNYSQILINGKSIFSPLLGLYGMEQIPTNMIERIEVVRGGGSSLYGSSAVGGVVNVITKLPSNNHYNFGYILNRINGTSNDKLLSGNAAILNSNENSGAAFFINNRERMWYDHNNDNFSELPKLKDNTFGANLFLIPYKNHKLELNLGSLYEYRYGGEMVDKVPHLAMQAEERIHNVLLGNFDYSFNFNKNLGSFTLYLAAQKTNREHYTGIRPDIGSEEDEVHLLNPPYGSTLNITKQFGFQLNYKLNKFLGANTFTIGYEHVSDDILDEISAYNYLIDRNILNSGSFIQSDWIFSENLSLLSGLRLDNHSLVKGIIINPRFSFLYNIRQGLQFRSSYSTGFRAPQAFDTDLHMAFSGGGISRVILDDNLKEENSKSISSSINFDKVFKHYYGLTLEGFYTYLDDAFYLDNIGEDQFGEIYLKKNGEGAKVKGFLIDLRANIYQKLQIESGMTFQESIYNKPISYSTSLASTRQFLRSPNQYGYAIISYFPYNNLFCSVNYLYTGSMKVLHLAGSPNQDIDEIYTSPSFNTIGFKVTYTQKIDKVGVKLEYSLGVKNLTNSYQNNFDSFKNRDSNFIYGPSSPRMLFFNLVLESL